MKKERRQAPREECDCQLSVAVNNRELDANLRNISQGGAFLHIAKKDSGKITSIDTGQIISFRLARDKININYSGTINRYIEVNSNKYLAVSFNGQTTEEVA